MANGRRKLKSCGKFLWYAAKSFRNEKSKSTILNPYTIYFFFASFYLCFLDISVRLSFIFKTLILNFHELRIITTQPDFSPLPKRKHQNTHSVKTQTRCSTPDSYESWKSLRGVFTVMKLHTNSRNEKKAQKSTESQAENRGIVIRVFFTMFTYLISSHIFVLNHKHRIHNIIQTKQGWNFYIIKNIWIYMEDWRWKKITLCWKHGQKNSKFIIMYQNIGHVKGQKNDPFFKKGVHWIKKKSVELTSCSVLSLVVYHSRTLMSCLEFMSESLFTILIIRFVRIKVHSGLRGPWTC